MKISLLFAAIAGVLIACLTSLASAQEPGSRWQLRVTDLQKQLKVEATIRLSSEPAQSCMGGSWKRAVVETTTAQAGDFFPVTGPLAYKLEDGVLTLGRTEVCDGYLFLTGKAQQPVIEGTYDAVGFGSRQLGSFSLQKIR